MELPGRRSRGRPLTIYMDAIIEDMKTGGTMVVVVVGR